MKNLKSTFLCALFTFITISLVGQSSGGGIIWAACGGSAVSQDDIEIGENTPDGESDSTKAVIAHNIWLVAKADKVECNEEDNCDDNQKCKKRLAGVGSLGSFPTPTQVGGEWEFPAQGTQAIFVRCKCLSQRITQFEIIKTASEPYIFEGGGLKGDQESTNRNASKFNSINIYPNPTRNKLNVDFETAKFEGSVKGYIYNNIGQLVKTVEFDSRHGSQKSIDTSTLDNGIYFLTISNGKSLVKKAKFIISED